ncbi:LPXTG cell wall anchor domain-containing protein, partial [Weissella viridescens]
KELEDAKKDAKDQIDKLPNLTDKEKEDIKKDIDDAKTTDEVDEIVEDAKDQNEANQDSKNLEDAKNDAKNQIDKLPNLTDQEKDDLKKRVDEATSTDDINNILDEAKRQNDAKTTDPSNPTNQDKGTDGKGNQGTDGQAQDGNNLEDVKSNGKNQIDGLQNLTEQEKNDFKARIDAATSEAEVNAIINEAKALSAQRAADKKQAQLPNTGVEDAQNAGLLGGAMLGALALFGLGKRNKKREEK